MNETVSKFIDTVRWIAAALVLVTHLNDRPCMVIADIPREHHNLLLYGWVFLYGFAHQAVVVFFVLSGFLVGGAVIARLRKETFGLGQYCIDRTARIYVVLVPTLLLTFLFDAFGRVLFADVGAYQLDIYKGHYEGWLIFANLAGLQDIFFKTYGTNSSLWTLSHEYWNYITFPFLCLAFFPHIRPLWRWSGFALGVALTVIMSVSGSWHFLGFLIWMIGAAAFALPRPLIANKWLALTLFLCVSIGIRITFRFAELKTGLLNDVCDFAVALTFANLLLTLRFAPKGWSLLNWSGHKVLSDFSYSLYAIHMPIITFICAGMQHAFGFGWRNVPSTPAHWALAFATFAGTMLFAWAFAQMTEHKTPAVRIWAYQLFARTRSRLWA